MNKFQLSVAAELSKEKLFLLEFESNYVLPCIVLKYEYNEIYQS